MMPAAGVRVGHPKAKANARALRIACEKQFKLTENSRQQTVQDNGYAGSRHAAGDTCGGHRPQGRYMENRIAIEAM
jgi:hypothetical protein